MVVSLHGARWRSERREEKVFQFMNITGLEAEEIEVPMITGFADLWHDTRDHATLDGVHFSLEAYLTQLKSITNAVCPDLALDMG